MSPDKINYELSIERREVRGLSPEQSNTKSRSSEEKATKETEKEWPGW